MIVGVAGIGITFYCRRRPQAAAADTEAAYVKMANQFLPDEILEGEMSPMPMRAEV